MTIALPLIAATGLKACNVPAFSAKDGLLANKSVLIAAVGLEMAVGNLILALRDRTAWWLTIGLFSAFPVTASYSIISHTECNCFGFDWLGLDFPSQCQDSTGRSQIQINSQLAPRIPNNRNGTHRNQRIFDSR